MNREAIYKALFDRVADAVEFRTVGRRVKAWGDVPPAEQPALFMSQVGEDADVKTKLPTVWTLNVELYIYAYADEADYVNPPAKKLNELLDAVTNALLPDKALEEQTLGGLVHRCRISGRIETDEGLLGPQGVAVIPIEIVLPQT